MMMWSCCFWKPTCIRRFDLCVRVCGSVWGCLRTCMCLHLCTHMHVYLFITLYSCTGMDTSVCVCVCVCVCVSTWGVSVCLSDVGEFDLALSRRTEPGSQPAQLLRGTEGICSASTPVALFLNAPLKAASSYKFPTEFKGLITVISTMLWLEMEIIT